MHPVTGTGNIHATHITKGARTSVQERIRRPTLGATQQQRGTGNPLPETARFFDIERIGRLRTHVVIEFPGIGPILIAVDAVYGQVIRLRRRQMLVRLLHALHRLAPDHVWCGPPAAPDLQ